MAQFWQPGALRTYVLCLLVNPALVRVKAKCLSALCVGLQTEMQQRVCKETVHYPKAD